MANPGFQACAQLEKVVQPWLKEPDWEGIFRLTELIRSDQSEVSRALIIRYYDLLKERNAKVCWLALVSLDALVKHGGDFFVGKVATLEFMQLLKDICKKRWVKKKKPVVGVVNYKNLCGLWVAHMIHHWGTLYPNIWNSKFPIFNQVYASCLSEGVQFPGPSDERPPEMTVPPKITPELPQSAFGGYQQQSKRQPTALAVIEEEIASARSAIALLADIIANTPAGKLQGNDLALDISAQLAGHAKALSKYATNNLDNESLLKTLLGVHDQVSAILEKYKNACKSGRYASSTSSDDEIILKKAPSQQKAKPKGKGVVTTPNKPVVIQSQQTHPFLSPMPGSSPFASNPTSNSFATNPYIISNPPQLAHNHNTSFGAQPQPQSQAFNPTQLPYISSNPFVTGPPGPQPQPIATNPFLTNPNPFATSPFSSAAPSPSPFTVAPHPKPNLQPISPQPGQPQNPFSMFS